MNVWCVFKYTDAGALLIDIFLKKDDAKEEIAALYQFTGNNDYEIVSWEVNDGVD